MTIQQMIYDLNYHYFWLLHQSDSSNSLSKSHNLKISSSLLEMIKSFELEQLKLLCLTEKTVFTWHITSDTFRRSSRPSPYIPKDVFIQNFFKEGAPNE